MVIIRVSTNPDTVYTTTGLRTVSASGSGAGSAKNRRIYFADPHATADDSNTTVGVGPHRSNMGVQITLDTVTHKDHSEVELDNMADITPPDHQKVDALV